MATRNSTISTTTTALIYLRKSTPDPRHPERSRSVEEQETECRATCEREGWQVVQVVTDDARSARRGSKARPGWEAAKAAIAAGGVDVLVTWEASRAQRDLDAYGELRRLCEAAGVKWNYGERTYDMGDRDDRFRTGLDALVAEDEAERAAERVQRAMRANAAKGRPHGRRLYGYRRTYDPTTGVLVGQEAHPDEAPVVVEVMERLSVGESMRGIAIDLEDRGVPGPTGQGWNGTQVRRIARNPAYVAQRVHQGEVVGPADWPPLVTDELFAQVGLRLAPGAGGRSRPARPGGNLLSGVLVCGVCGRPLWRGHDRRKRDVYVCRTRKFTDAEGNDYGIGHVSIGMEKADNLVRDAVAVYLARPEVADVVTANDDTDPATAAAVAHVEQLRRRLDDATAAYRAGDLSITTLAKIENELTNDIAEAERAVARAVLPAVVVDSLGGRFVDLDTPEQREVIRAVVRPVVARGRVGARFDPERIRFDWLV